MSKRRRIHFNPTSIWMMWLRFFTNSIQREKRNSIIKTSLATQLSKRNLTSKLRSRSKRDKREKRKSSGRE
jgi:hypothetical protein